MYVFKSLSLEDVKITEVYFSQFQYSKVEEFLRDLRKMFKNCYKFHPSHTEYYRHAKELEETLDKRLEEWLPEFAYDQTLSSLPAVGSGRAPKNSKR